MRTYAIYKNGRYLLTERGMMSMPEWTRKRAICARYFAADAQIVAMMYGGIAVKVG